ncbi:hypothetical protein [Labrys miyagiensis]
MAAISATPSLINLDYTINPNALKVDPSYSYVEQVSGHQKNLILMKKVNSYLDNAFTKSDSAQVVRDATIGRDSLLVFVITYDVASKRAKALASDGYLLKDIRKQQNLKQVEATQTEPRRTTAEACNQQGKCSDVDPIVAVFMIAIDALTKEFKKEKPFGPNNDLVKFGAAVKDFIDNPAGGPNSAFVKARSLVIPQNDQGEVAKLLRDPGNRTIEIIEGALKFLNEDNGIVAQAITRPGSVIFGGGWDPRPQDNGDIAKALRDPVNCTVGKLWGGC